MEVFHSKVRVIKKERYILRKKRIFFTTLLFFIACGCTTRKEDVEHALIIVDGANESNVYSSVNADNDEKISGKEYALENFISISINENEKLHILFICDTCDHKEEYDVVGTPTELLIQCDCPEEGDNDGNIKEYIDIIVSIKEQ